MLACLRKQARALSAATASAPQARGWRVRLLDMRVWRRLRSFAQRSECLRQCLQLPAAAPQSDSQTAADSGGAGQRQAARD